MTMLFTDGFEAGDYATKWDVGLVGGLTAVTRYGIGSAYTYGGNSGQTGVLKKNFTASDKVILGCGFKTVLNSDASNLIGFWGDNGTINHLNLRFLTTGAVVLARGSTVIATSVATGLVTVNQWAFWECAATINDTTGTCQVRINGQLVIDFTGDTKNAGTANTIDAISFHQAGVTSATPQVDDVYICNGLGTINNNFLGDVRVVTLVPDGAGSSTQFTPTGVANNWDNVNELPTSAADYNVSATVGQKDLYAMNTVTAVAVHAVVPNLIVRKADAGLIGCRTLLKSGATTANGATIALGTATDTYFTVHETDPATGVAWTPAAIANIEAGIEVQ